MKKSILLICMGLILLSSAIIKAEVPGTISYQGYYKDSNGDPKNGDANVVFRLYTEITDGTKVWEENQNVTFTDGYFNVQLGINTSLADIDFSVPYFISTQVGTILMSPRQQLNSVPYSLYAKKSATVDDNSVTTDKLADKNVTRGKIADNAVGLSQMEMYAVLPVGTIIAWYNYTGTYLPANWVKCNGGVVSDSDSPINGKAIPNLNGEKRFLRGGSTAGALEADELKSHTHQVISSWPSGNATEWHVVANWSDPGEGPTSDMDGPSLTDTGGTETRPINMTVIWIMKIK